MSAWLLNGLVAVPFVFAVLTRLLGRREGTAVAVAVLGGLVTFGWSVAAAPGSPSSACGGTSSSTASAHLSC